MPSLLLLSSLLTPLLIPIYHFYTHLSVLGVFTLSTGLPSIRSANPLIQSKFRLHDVLASEDMAVHPPTGKIVFVGQERMDGRYAWFPPAGCCADPGVGAIDKGAMWVVDPQDWKPVQLPIHRFDGPFITHGIGLYTPPFPSNSTSAYLHAVNHPAHPLTSSSSNLFPGSCGTDSTPAADSRIEIFSLDLDPLSPTFGATHVRTVKHDLIRTPNDVLSLGPGEFVVSNDHKRRSGTLRDMEDIITWRKWAGGELVHVVAPLPEVGAEGQARGGAGIGSGGVGGGTDVQARVILSGLHNPNGLGPGFSPSESLLVDASGGILHTLQHTHTPDGQLQLSINDSVPLPNTLDNPFVLSDPYATSQSDISGYVLGGLLRGAELAPTWTDKLAFHPWSVHLVRKKADGRGWDKVKILQDDGRFVNALSSALIVPIKPDPEKRNGRGEVMREGWVVLTSFFAERVGVVRVDLTDWARR